MVEVRATYKNFIKETKFNKTDRFVYFDVEVKGHAEHTGYTNNTRVCAGISACCLGIVRLIDDSVYHVHYEKGYFHIWLDRVIDTHNITWLDRESMYALNTLVCQLYEIYNNYPNAFKCFELIDLKETNTDYEERTKHHNTTRRQENKRKMGLHSIIEKIDFEEN